MTIITLLVIAVLILMALLADVAAILPALRQKLEDGIALPPEAA